DYYCQSYASSKWVF
nr:immunoglobulin light chain junction region [Macaca mulatta]MOW31142.1 immunoglobulin light chain junction region [Macaca mulatta]MOW31262.1 immunoglobulin light chain junction region [Macaca mulatta]MOW31321.1 immunoglobulin light chain junction region [Macaca mulatta]MOW31357.1 immunoglobulin light chain junction region [Macaca mulatta]